MRRSKFIPLVLVFVLIGTLTACASMAGPDREALVRILGRRIGLHGTQLYPGIFIDLGRSADRACPQRGKKAMPAEVALSLIAKAIKEKTDDPFLLQDLVDVLEIIGIDINKSLDVINLTPEIQGMILQFVCSFAQGVDRAKQNL